MPKVELTMPLFGNSNGINHRQKINVIKFILYVYSCQESFKIKESSPVRIYQNNMTENFMDFIMSKNVKDDIINHN